MASRRNREECTRLLSLLVSHTQRLIKPYALPMLRVLLLKAHDPSPVVAAHIIMCLGELVCVGGEDAIEHVPDLMKIILTRLGDVNTSNNARRNAALHTLGQVCSSTGYVIEPLIDHPELLELLSKILQTEPDKIIKREVVKVLGILGALDPYKRKVGDLCLQQKLTLISFQPKVVEEVIDTSENAANSVNQISLLRPLSSSPDDYFQSVVIVSLLAILKDSALSNHHHAVIEAIMSIFKTQGLKCVSFMPQVSAIYLDHFHGADKSPDYSCFHGRDTHSNHHPDEVFLSGANDYPRGNHSAAHPELHARNIPSRC